MSEKSPKSKSTPEKDDPNQSRFYFQVSNHPTFKIIHGWNQQDVLEFNQHLSNSWNVVPTSGVGLLCGVNALQISLQNYLTYSGLGYLTGGIDLLKIYRSKEFREYKLEFDLVIEGNSRGLEGREQEETEGNLNADSLGILLRLIAGLLTDLFTKVGGYKKEDGAVTFQLGVAMRTDQSGYYKIWKHSIADDSLNVRVIWVVNDGSQDEAGGVLGHWSGMAPSSLQIPTPTVPDWFRDRGRLWEELAEEVSLDDGGPDGEEGENHRDGSKDGKSKSKQEEKVEEKEKEREVIVMGSEDEESSREESDEEETDGGESNEEEQEQEEGQEQGQAAGQVEKEEPKRNSLDFLNPDIANSPKPTENDCETFTAYDPTYGRIAIRLRMMQAHQWISKRYFKNATDCVRHASTIATVISDPSMQAKCHFWLAFIHLHQGRWDDALTEIGKTTELGKEYEGEFVAKIREGLRRVRKDPATAGYEFPMYSTAPCPDDVGGDRVPTIFEPSERRKSSLKLRFPNNKGEEHPSSSSDKGKAKSRKNVRISENKSQYKPGQTIPIGGSHNIKLSGIQDISSHLGNAVKGGS